MGCQSRFRAFVFKKLTIEASPFLGFSLNEVVTSAS
jgi:hypothetical protein